MYGIHTAAERSIFDMRIAVPSWMSGKIGRVEVAEHTAYDRPSECIYIRVGSTCLACVGGKWHVFISWHKEPSEGTHAYPVMA